MPIMRNLLIVAAMLAAATAQTVVGATIALDQRYPDATEVFHCAFGDTADANRDGWPDRWTRERSASHPPYLEVRIDGQAPQADQRSLRMSLDGGAAAAYSPAIPVQSAFNYVFECLVKTDGLEHDRAYMSVTFYDAQNQVLERQISSGIGGSTPWTRLRIGPVAPASEAAHHAVIGLHLEPGEQADLTGTAWFADVWAGHLPRLKLQADRRDRLYIDPQRPEISCTASGFVDQNATVDFELLDVAGRQLRRERMALQLDDAVDNGIALSGRASWKPPLADVGFYRVRVSLSGRTDAQHQQEIALALIRDQKSDALAPALSQREKNPQGEFGWTLPDGEKPLTLDELADLAQQAGINWLKYPVWEDAADARRGERLVSFAERLQAMGVELVGLLADPPAEVRKRLGDRQHLAAAQIFSAEPDVWYPLLEPIVSRLALNVHWWQLGRDDDLSFVNHPHVAAIIDRVSKQLGRYGQDVRLGIGWSWLKEPPKDIPSLKFISLWPDPPIGATEQADYLDRMKQTKIRRWVVIEPLAAGECDSLERARDLSQRMLAAKTQGADAIFLPRLFSTSRGLFNEDGAVGELFLPWRTTAQALAGADYLGNIRLPNSSSNQVFARDRQLTMVLWNDKPGDEQVVLGDKVRQIDLWGATTQPPLNAQGQQRINVGSLPVFLTDLSEPLVRWQMSTALEQTQWPNVFGEPHFDALSITNPFPQSATGKVRLVAPNGWRVVPREIQFKLAAGTTQRFPFEVTLPLDASTGRQEVRLDFDLFADRRYQFSVLRSVDIGNDDVTVETTTRLNEQGELVVEQKFVNRTDQPVSFKCYLFAPDRRRLVTQVLEQKRGSDTQTYRLPNGKELLGKTLWLRAEELTGRRMLNYRFAAQP